jgi:hypothetical protein
MFKTAEAAFVRLRGLLLCADNDDVEGFFGCSKQSIRRRNSTSCLWAAPSASG